MFRAGPAESGVLEDPGCAPVPPVRNAGMRLPIIHGLIRRRLLVNFRVDPEVAARLLPGPFRPKTHRGHALAGICLIRLEGIRLGWLPRWAGLASENAAHRFAVEWDDSTTGQPREGVYIPRRDTSLWLNHLAGGRLFPGEHHRADFAVTDDGNRIDLSARARDGGMALEVRARVGDALPASSCFGSLASASAFFETGSLGYSATREGHRLDGITLTTESWQVRPLTVEHVASSYFADEALFPPGSAVLDHALLMRDITHRWVAAPDLITSGGGPNGGRSSHLPR